MLFMQTMTQMPILPLTRSYKMENTNIIEVLDPLTDRVETFVIIDRGNGEFTSMLKSTYDAIQAEQSTPMVADE